MHQPQRDRLIVDPLQVVQEERVEFGGDLRVVHRVNGFELPGQRRPVEQDTRALRHGILGVRAT